MRKAIAPLAVFAAALAVRALTAAGISFPIPEDSAYYVDVARNVAAGRGFVSDVVWSYATAPLAVPRPAFDLWQPLVSFIEAPFMVLLGRSLAAAQLPSVLLGAAVAPLAWLVARRAADEMGLAPGRADVVAFTSGLLVALTPLLVIQSAEPDSSTPYTALAVAACALMPATLGDGPGTVQRRLLLGAAIGLAFLARTDALYIVAAYVALAAIVVRQARLPVGLVARHAAPALAIAALVSLPWVVRQAVTWTGSPLGQFVQNMWLVRFTDIFAWSTPPTLASHLALGPLALAQLRLEALVSDALLLLIVASPAAIVGIVALVLRRDAAMAPSLLPLALVGALTFFVDALVFPVASQSGLWAHGAGPAIVFVAIMAAFGLEALLARVGAARGWRSPSGALSRSGVIAPLAVAIVSAPLIALAGTLEHERSTTTAAQYQALASASVRWDLAVGSPIVSDHPMWVAETTDHPALPLPREAPGSVVDLMRHFGAEAVVIRGDDAEVAASGLALAAYRDATGRACFRELPAVAPFRAFGFACATVTATLGEP